MKRILLSVVIFAFCAVSVSAQHKIPLIGTKAPSFTTNSTNGVITFPDDFGKSWKILFSHPQDFTPVCTSELLELANMQNEFKKMNVNVAVISTDNVERHKEWKTSLEEMNYKGRNTPKIEFPIMADKKALISNMYGMVHPTVSTDKDIRGVFIIDPDNNICSINFYPMQVGRNINEILRTIVALQKVNKEMVFTPANWENGDDVIVPHYPYTEKELAENPDIVNDYYNVGNRMWFKKEKKAIYADEEK